MTRYSTFVLIEMLFWFLFNLATSTAKLISRTSFAGRNTDAPLIVDSLTSDETLTYKELINLHVEFAPVYIMEELTWISLPRTDRTRVVPFQPIWWRIDTWSICKIFTWRFFSFFFSFYLFFFPQNAVEKI